MSRIDTLVSYRIKVTTDWINYALLDDIIDAYVPTLKRVEAEVDAIDDLVLVIRASEQSEMLKRIGRARKQVTSISIG